MKRIITTVFVFSLFIVSTYATSYHTIPINGSVGTKWASDEDFTDISSADNAFFTWDADYIYFGIKDAEADYSNFATFMYFDADPAGANGTNDGYTWGGIIGLPFKADYTIVWKNGGDYIQVMHWNGSNWEQVASATSSSLNTDAVNFSAVNGNDYREVRIKRSLLGSPAAIKVCSFSEQQWGSFWRYFAWPSEGWTDGNRVGGQAISHYRGYDLGPDYSPDAIGAYDGVLPVELTSFTALAEGANVSLNWKTATEVNNYGFNVERKSVGGEWMSLGFIEGAGNSNSPKDYSYSDNNLRAGNYIYRLKQMDVDGKFQYSQEAEVSVNGVPSEMTLEANYPNPFNPSTMIKFTAAKNEHAELVVYDQLGKEVSRLFSGMTEAGKSYQVQFTAQGLPSGIYFYRLRSAGNTEVRKMLLMK